MHPIKIIPHYAATPPPFYLWAGFSPQIALILLVTALIQLLAFASVLLVNVRIYPNRAFHSHLIYSVIPKNSNVNHLSTLLHNLSLPLDKTTFPSSLKLFFATGKIEPP